MNSHRINGLLDPSASSDAATKNYIDTAVGSLPDNYILLQTNTPGMVQIGNENITGKIIAGSFSGTGTDLTNLNASNLSTGTLPDGRLSGTYTNALTFNNSGNIFSGSGALLTSLNATQLTSGTVPSARISGAYSNALNLSNTSNVINVSDPTVNSNAVNMGWALAQFAPIYGSANYIQDQNSLPQAADFYINGTGTVNNLKVEGDFKGQAFAGSKLSTFTDACTSGNWTNLSSSTITASGTGSVVIVSGYLSGTTKSGYPQIGMRIRKDTTTIGINYGGSYFTDYLAGTSLTTFDQPSAGTYTYYLDYCADWSTAQNYGITVFELKE
jgi:hypothetical protein